MKSFLTRVMVGEFSCEGEGNSKKLSKKRAALSILQELKKLPFMPVIEKPKLHYKKRPKTILKVGRNSRTCARESVRLCVHVSVCVSECVSVCVCVSVELYVTRLTCLNNFHNTLRLKTHFRSDGTGSLLKLSG